MKGWMSNCRISKGWISKGCMRKGLVNEELGEVGL